MAVLGIFLRTGLRTDWAVLLACRLVDLAGHPHAAQAVDVFGDAAVEGLGNALPVFAGFEPTLVCRVRYEGNLRQNRGHVCPNQHDEWRLLHAAVANRRTLGR